MLLLSIFRYHPLCCTIISYALVYLL